MIDSKFFDELYKQIAWYDSIFTPVVKNCSSEFFFGGFIVNKILQNNSARNIDEINNELNLIKNEYDDFRHETDKIIDKLKESFMVGSLSYLKREDMFAFLKTNVSRKSTEKEIILRNAWVSLAMKIANGQSCREYDAEKLMEETDTDMYIIKREGRQ